MTSYNVFVEERWRVGFYAEYVEYSCCDVKAMEDVDFRKIASQKANAECAKALECSKAFEK